MANRTHIHIHKTTTHTTLTFIFIEKKKMVTFNDSEANKNLKYCTSYVSQQNKLLHKLRRKKTFIDDDESYRNR